VAATILVASEGGILPPGITARCSAAFEDLTRSARRELFPPGWEARLYGRQGCLTATSNLM
jgi:hypothetical protein